jgi:large subunit ribosomal protein L29
VKARELRELTDEELKERERDLREELFNLRFQIATNQAENPQIIRNVRRDLARVLTILRERELATEKETRRKA